ncbi:oligoribonuclease [Blochmannia endosymbiont of Colobopsis nipponica]|uniref:oligoribonuclease n=1 Tax=Blochmannia endosymbiont of Colobopsis nipponica TaxID=2681987 RepID=UPI001783A99C|nr:oligoribonuclease [Blochmannia endosymbiont of Colobopsis nipponica]QOI10777.1 oligoribonuclease [Blochmannia endosymbiont of Colobopsis nipponica]
MNEDNLVWIDLEMTGLNPDCDRILEIATLVTDVNLNVLAEGPVLAIYQSDEQLSCMDQWNISTHTSTGLIDRVRKSCFSEKVSATLTLDFLKQWVPCGKSPICGNSVGQDRRFLFRYMPQLESYFHYHCLDVSTIRELVYRWKPVILNELMIHKTHQALDDIRNSVIELIYYRNHFLSLL